jgi:hypothetical protein
LRCCASFAETVGFSCPSPCPAKNQTASSDP